MAWAIGLPLDCPVVRRQRQVGEWVYESKGRFRWTVTDRSNVPLADGAGWVDSDRAARQQILLALREILRSDLAGLDLEVARHLASLGDTERAAVIENADEIRSALVRED